MFDADSKKSGELTSRVLKDVGCPSERQIVSRRKAPLLFPVQKKGEKGGKRLVIKGGGRRKAEKAR